MNIIKIVNQFMPKHASILMVAIILEIAMERRFEFPNCFAC